MGLTITGEQRDALYDQILDRVEAIEDVWLTVSAGNFEAAKRLGMAYSDELRLVSEDLGWGEGTGDAVELTAPPDVLRRVFTRLRDSTASLQEYEAREQADSREFAARTRLVGMACDSVLANLEGEV